MSLESGWEARTPVQVRSERLSAATASMDLGGAAAAAAAAAAPLEEEEEEEGATGALAPLLAAAAAFFCAAFFLLASETMMILGLSSWAGAEVEGGGRMVEKNREEWPGGGRRSWHEH